MIVMKRCTVACKDSLADCGASLAASLLLLWSVYLLSVSQPKLCCRSWSSIHEQRHVVVHLPSLGLLEGQRQGLSKPQVRENSQMARLCDLADPLVEVVYVAPFSLPEVRRPLMKREQ